MISRFDHRALLTGSVLRRVDKIEDRDSWWERRETLHLGEKGDFDWIVEIDSRDNGAAKPKRVTERATGLWQVVGESNGPHFLQLMTGNGDMYSWAARPGAAGEHLINNKSWQRSAATLERV
ncbi:hypothetical protein [Sandarakinorhabdus oryzae]|uniref:hypothetical protein n=1 Tax=Sandarakinorhabdus oryzae TaxID=2675220 RepID=UPI0012E13489|nr:hypothetical protein [Sandarakinorhabdus oryzae]